MASVKSLCNTGVLLENGMVKMIDNVETVIRQYQKVSQNVRELDVLRRMDRKGNQKILLKNILIKNSQGELVDLVCSGESFNIEVVLLCQNWLNTDQVNELCIGINDEYGQRNILLNNIFIGKNVEIKEGELEHTLTFKVSNCPLTTGCYSMAFYLDDKRGQIVDWIDNVGSLQVVAGDFYGTGKINRAGLGRFLVSYDLE